MTNTVYVMGTGLWLMTLMMAVDGRFMIDEAAQTLFKLAGF